MPLKFNTSVNFDCPYDCGLCTDHEQHTCVGIVEITDRCNLTCPTCYAMSSPNYGRHRTPEEVEKMLDILVENEGEPDVVQISGGEPTIHPQFFEILDMAKTRPIRHLMVNTNGIRIAKEKGFAEKLAKYMPGFEIYLQFDSLQNEAYQKIRGADLLDIKLEAIKNLNEWNLSTTLVVTLQKGVNTDEIGKLLTFASKEHCVRGVTFQPTQVAGRNKNFDPEKERYTLSEVRQAILDQWNIFQPEDLVPVPCNPDSLVMAYALKTEGKIVPLTRYISPQALLDSSRNIITYEKDAHLKEKILSLFSTSKSCEDTPADLHDLLCCLPKISAPDLTYKDVFRVIVMEFMDAYNFDVRGVKKSCVHIVHKDGRIIPFDTMNLFYRDDKQKYLDRLRKEI